MELNMNKNGFIQKVNGPVIHVRDAAGLSMQEMVKVGNVGLIGEVISIEPTEAIVQGLEYEL